MYELDWKNEARWAAEAELATYTSQLSRGDVEATLLLRWEEHCVECAMPDCYTVCPLYGRRGDGACARFEYGIYPHPGVKGLFDHGADVRFKRWGTILSHLYFGKALTPAVHRRLATGDRVAGRVLPAAFGAVRGRQPGPGRMNFHRDRLLRELPIVGPEAFDEFVLECVSPDPEPFRLVLEHHEGGRVRFRHAFDIQPGQNFHTLPASVFGDVGQPTEGWVQLQPERDGESRLIFSWLDFVRYTPSRRPASPAAPTPAVADVPAEKVKCVAWDLDNTLWGGTLVERATEGCELRPGVLELIDRLDERGIVQTVVSKNDHDEAWAEVTRLGLADWFVYPAINWGRKSENLKQVARSLNIGLDTVAFIDDSPFERAEVREALPMVRVYSEDGLAELLDRPELDVPVTSMSRQRRLSYLNEMQRERVQESFGDDYLAFLRSCELRTRVFVPGDDGEVERCRELVARSNQLNLAKRSYTPEQFATLVQTPGVLPLAVACEDRFGDYGIVGFVCVDERGDAPLVRDLVLSCRVAQKRIEHTILGWLAQREGEAGGERIQAELVRTARNGPLQRVFDELPFRVAWTDGSRALLELDVHDAAETFEPVMTLQVEAPPGRRAPTASAASS